MGSIVLVVVCAWPIFRKARMMTGEVGGVCQQAAIAPSLQQQDITAVGVMANPDMVAKLQPHRFVSQTTHQVPVLLVLALLTAIRWL
jgi:hypothetical protein